jgi:hypothetical protein
MALCSVNEPLISRKNSSLAVERHLFIIHYYGERFEEFVAHHRYKEWFSRLEPASELGVLDSLDLHCLLSVVYRISSRRCDF